MEGRYYLGKAGYKAGIAIENTARALNIRPLKTQKEKRIDEESAIRRNIQARIRELKKLGFPKKEALKRINSEFSDSGFLGFFEGWVDNWYKETKYHPYKGIERDSKEGEER